MHAFDPNIRLGRRVEVQPGIQLHVASMESGRPVMVLLHGFPEFWAAWKDLMPLLAEQFDVIAPDLRGFNLDWGGAVAWNLAAQYPDLLHKLVILNSPHPYSFWRDLRKDPQQQAASQYMNWLRQPGCEVALAADHFKRLESFFLRMGGASWFDDRTRVLYQEAWSQPGALEAMCNYYRASPLFPPTEQEPGPLGFELDPETFRVSVPTQVIWGDADTALPVGLLSGIEPYIDNLKVDMLPGATHWLCHEQPRKVADLILKESNE